jgi:serine/threonine-protein kinase
VAIALRHLRDQPQPLPEEVPAGVRTLIERATVKDPTQRYPDGAAVVAAIDELRAGRQLPPVQRTDTQSFWLLPDAAALAGASPATDPGAPVRRRSDTRLGRMLVPVAALLVGAGLAAAVLQVLPSTAPETTAASAEVTGTATSTPDALVLARSDYVGRPVGAVQAQLEAMGLQVQTETVQTHDVAPGTVVDVAPLSVRLQVGQTVLVTYAVAPASSGSGSSAGTSSRVPADAVVQPSHSAPSTPAATATATASPTPTATATPSPTVTGTPSAATSEGAGDTGGATDGRPSGGGATTTPATTSAAPTSSATPSASTQG